MIIIANIGKRCLCRCNKTMEIIIGKEVNVLFSKGAVYDCVIRDEELVNYKIYGDEFTLACTEKEFNDYFVLIQNKKTSRV